MDAIATASFKEGIQTYNIRLVCTVIRYIQYLQYLIPQPPVRLKVDKKSITIFKLIQYLLNTHGALGKNLQYWVNLTVSCTAPETCQQWNLCITNHKNNNDSKEIISEVRKLHQIYNYGIPTKNSLQTNADVQDHALPSTSSVCLVHSFRGAKRYALQNKK